MCDYSCWNKTFELVEQCVVDNSGVKSSLVNEKDMLLNLLQVHCWKNPTRHVSCGQLQIEFYLTEQELGAEACKSSSIKKSSCPGECKTMMTKATNFLGCCLGSQQVYATANKLSDPTDILGTYLYWSKDYCGIKVPARCPGQIISQLREVSGECNTKVMSLNRLSECSADWYKFQFVIMLTREAALASSCYNSTSCMSTVDHYIQSLAHDADVLCLANCHKHLVATLEACYVDLYNASSSALVPLSLLCYDTSTTLTNTINNCAVRYQMHMSHHQLYDDPCNLPSYKNGQCIKACLTHLNNLTDAGLGCCLVSLVESGISRIEPNIVSNLNVCMSHQSKSKQTCKHHIIPSPSPSSLPSSTPSERPSEQPKPQPKSKSTYIPAIVGGVLAALALLLALLALLAHFYCKEDQKEGADGVLLTSPIQDHRST
ncbi:uncharacterized protein LOC134193164 [Corticium candelabrum]|uniref:uncharacterized protein LOC134193164 n=1 Tax=Corticium candelabrum TaxID=121492 RepID=UPI002E2724C8|nr:uncharacterized protein LOC134193164 [Corticium candelabrum]